MPNPQQIALYDYDVERLNRHKMLLLRYCRKLVNELDEARARAIRAEQEIDKAREIYGVDFPVRLP